MTTEQQPDQPKPNTADYYDAFAPVYDQETQAIGWPAKVEALMGEVFGFKPPETVRATLDLGAGTGIAIEALKKRAAPDRIVAVDASTEMLARLRQKYDTPDISVITATIEDYVAACQEKFDLITAIAVLELVPDLPPTMKRAATLLNPGGIMAVTYVPQAAGEAREILTDDSDKIGQSMLEYRWRPEEVEQAVTDSGLTILKRLGAITAQEQDAAAHTEERTYNFIIAQKSDS